MINVDLGCYRHYFTFFFFKHEGKGVGAEKVSIIFFFFLNNHRGTFER